MSELKYDYLHVEKALHGRCTGGNYRTHKSLDWPLTWNDPFVGVGQRIAAPRQEQPPPVAPLDAWMGRLDRTLGQLTNDSMAPRPRIGSYSQYEQHQKPRQRLLQRTPEPPIFHIPLQEESTALIYIAYLESRPFIT